MTGYLLFCVYIAITYGVTQAVLEKQYGDVKGFWKRLFAWNFVFLYCFFMWPVGFGELVAMKKMDQGNDDL